MTQPARPLPLCPIDVLVESPLWNGIADIESCVRRAVAAALPPERADCGLAVVLTDDQTMRGLNARFRGSDTATNVLSFPTPRSPGPPADQSHGEPISLGDIVIAFETVRAEAVAEGKEFGHHVAHLLVHGVLHLLGYDHHSDPEAEAMEARERAILMQLDMPDPYAERDRVPADGHGCA
ncbi:MAG: rRNA maturation RNase YbeY [Rhodoplanes sp.]